MNSINNLTSAEKRRGGKVSVLTLAVLSALASSAASSGAMASDNWWSPLFEDGRVALRNVNEIKGEDSWSKPDSDHQTMYETRGAFVAHFSSGMVGSKNLSMGMKLGAASVYKLGDRNLGSYWGDSNMQQSNCTINWKGYKVCDDTEGFSRVTQMSMKAQLGKNRNRRTQFNLGLDYLNGGMIDSFDPDDDMIPKSYLGADFSSKWYNLSLSGALVTGKMLKSDTSVQDLLIFADRRSPDGDQVQIDYVSSLEAGYKGDNMDFTLGYGNAENYMQRYVGRVGYFVDLSRDQSFRLDAAYNLNTFGGSKFDEAVALNIRDEYEDRSNLASVRAMYTYGNATLVLAHSRVGGTTGFSEYMAGVDSDMYHYAEGFIEDYTKSGDTSKMLRVIYDMNGFDIPVIRDLTFTYSYNRATKDIEDVHNGRTFPGTGSGEEHTLQINYEKNSGAFKGTMAKIKLGQFDPDGSWRVVADGEPDNVGKVNMFEVSMNFPIY